MCHVNIYGSIAVYLMIELQKCHSWSRGILQYHSDMLTYLYVHTDMLLCESDREEK